MKMKSTKRALLMSALSLILCISMLIGSTYAWFTDSVTSGRNKIVAGNLDVVLEYKTEASDEWAEVKDDTVLFNEASLWEPGHTEVVALRVRNAGTLALKYELATTVYEEVSGTNVAGETFKLSDYLVAYSHEAQADNMIGEIMTSLVLGNRKKATGTGTIMEEVGFGEVVALGEKLLPGDANITAIAIQMPETVGNEANYKTGTAAPYISFGVSLIATQAMEEDDSFGSDYDKDAEYPYTASGSLEEGASALEIDIVDPFNGEKVGSAVVPAEAVEDEEIDVKVVRTDRGANFEVAADQETLTYDVSVTGLKEGNTVPVKVSLRIPKDLDPATVALYHYDQLIPSTYDYQTGLVTFESADFSPFTVVYDAESEYEAPEADESKFPKADVTEYEVTEPIVWGSYGQWSPTEGLDAELEAIYKFACTETLEEAKANPYADWYCDFYVKLDKALGENEIFLGGNYGDFGWVGFHNGDLTLEANTEIGLLESVTSNPWTYKDVVQNVGEFICGVGDVNDALEGATFTVMLRLTNPADSADFVNVATINYTF